MPLPAGFKVHGNTAGNVLIPPRVKKIMAILDKFPADELLTSQEVGIRASLSVGGSWSNHPALVNYREKVDNKFFWGSTKSITKLRTQLAEPEDTNENQ